MLNNKTCIRHARRTLRAVRCALIIGIVAHKSSFQYQHTLIHTQEPFIISMAPSLACFLGGVRKLKQKKPRGNPDDIGKTHGTAHRKSSDRFKPRTLLVRGTSANHYSRVKKLVG